MLFMQRKIFRGPKSNALILTRKDKLNQIGHPFKIVKESENYLIIEIIANENE